jgi:hypothetical protein
MVVVSTALFAMQVVYVGLVLLRLAARSAKDPAVPERKEKGPVKSESASPSAVDEESAAPSSEKSGCE